ncbi:hypothetical protein C8A00DRAFT_38228 [Chaetomidium leptoderma]|uniref:Uncharacterized protein n=1 Tax=Chaetomidium leptoderma TaxID=669021 RepID=A0AAN6ZSE0_9PEZI|nr:hypothetical protein C8A00DRAFT_38228 [Chaetomidium leptoderma]
MSSSSLIAPHLRHNNNTNNENTNNKNTNNNNTNNKNTNNNNTNNKNTKQEQHHHGHNPTTTKMHPLHLLLPLLASTTTTAAQTILCPSDSNNTTPPKWTTTSYLFTFKPTLNYDFVTRTPQTVVQLCQNGGRMVDHALQITGATAWGIEPVTDLSDDSLGYVASALVVRAPEGFLSELNDQVGNSTSRLYNHEDLIVRQVAQQIDDSLEVVFRSEF